jgi:large subunit ribosomal protein L11
MSAKKALAASIKLVISAASAKPAPPVGPALGQAGVNIMAFCKEFNAKTQGYKDGVPLRVAINVYADKSFEWELKTPPAVWFIKKASGLARAADRPGHEHVATISLKHLYEIAAVKQADTPLVPLESMCKSLIRTCKSMGVRVVPRPEDA